MNDATTQELLESADNLADDQLQEFTELVVRLNAARRSHSLSTEETRLLKAINGTLPNASRVTRYHNLTGRRDDGILTADEHRELCELSDWLEEQNAERLGRVAQLARLRGVTLSEMIDQLGLHHLVEPT